MFREILLRQTLLPNVDIDSKVGELYWPRMWSDELRARYLLEYRHPANLQRIARRLASYLVFNCVDGPLEVGIFGSVARGEAGLLSDIDMVAFVNLTGMTKILTMSAEVMTMPYGLVGWEEVVATLGGNEKQVGDILRLGLPTSDKPLPVIDWQLIVVPCYPDLGAISLFEQTNGSGFLAGVGRDLKLFYPPAGKFSYKQCQKNWLWQLARGWDRKM